MSDEFDVLETIMSGVPVPVVIGDATWNLRQPRPLEVDKMRRAQQLAHDTVMAEYRAEGLDKQPVSDAMAETIRMYGAAQEAAYKAAMKNADQATAREALDDLAAIHWPANLAEERARDDARRTVARWIIDHLLEGDKEAFRKATAPDPLNHSDVVASVTRMLSLVNHDPNSNGRQVSG